MLDAVLGEALDVGIAELDRGQGVESFIDEVMAEIDAAAGLWQGASRCHDEGGSRRRPRQR